MGWYEQFLYRESQEQAPQKTVADGAEKRRTTILGSVFATGAAKPLAEHIASKTDLTTDQAIATLKIASTSGGTRATIPSLASRVPDGLGKLGLMDREDSARSGWDTVISKAWASRRKAARCRNASDR